MMAEFLANQEREKREVEEAHLFEYASFNKTWDEVCASLANEH
jgi:hypothetical protein